MGRANSGHQIASAIDAAEQRAMDAAPGLALVIYLKPGLDRGASDPIWRRAAH